MSAASRSGGRPLLAAALLALAGPVAAHKPSDAYVQVDVAGHRVEQRVDIALRDLERELALDADGDDAITWGEVRARWREIEALAEAGIRLQLEGGCSASLVAAPQLDEHSDGRYAVLRRSWTCAAPPQSFRLEYRLFETADPTHRGILHTTQARRELTAVLVPGPAATLVQLDGDAPRLHDAPPGGFVGEGIHHILVGTDHVLFLLALLLPAVAVWRRHAPAGLPLLRKAPALAGIGAGTGAGGGPWRTPSPSPWQWLRAGPARGRWDPAPAFAPVLWDVLKIVTAFTVAHSLTLALAVLEVVDPPSRAVEALIAASVVLAALNNLVPVVRTQRWPLAFAFGLVHGFGFAGALKALALDPATRAWTLFSFNLGVELGQVGIVLLFLPLAWACRRRRAWWRWGVHGGSMLVAAIGLGWLVERAFDLQLLR